MTCTGCGRLLGLRSEADCPCWASYSDKAIVPERLVTLTKSYLRLRQTRRR